jgi:4-diphosphocytidyl-2-C-methyl-D-erythritol kinase
MMRTARVRAFAKLNLGLRVLGKRPDQYHEIRTIFQTISLADVLEIGFASARTTRIEVVGTPEIADNLVARAARMLFEEVLKIHGHAFLHLKKNIPMGAGLGGGSSDAAAVLLALPVLAGKASDPERLFAVAAELGSDVPFFLQGGTALGLGRGEELYPLPDRGNTYALLIAPAIHSSTAEAYKGLSERLTSIPLQNRLFSFQQEVWQKVGAGLVNDFEEVVFARHPELGRIRDRLVRLGAHPAAMTGSGSAIFGMFKSRDHVIRAEKSLKGERAVRISFVSRTRYRSAWNRALAQHIDTKGDPWPPRSLYAR